MQYELRTESLESLQREGSTYQHVEYDNTPHETTTIILDKFITTPFPLPYNNTFQFKAPKAHKWEQWKHTFTGDTSDPHTQHEAFHVLSKLCPRIVESWLLPHMNISHIVIAKPLNEDRQNFLEERTVTDPFTHEPIPPPLYDLSKNTLPLNEAIIRSQNQILDLRRYSTQLALVENELKSISDEFYETVKHNHHLISFGSLNDFSSNDSDCGGNEFYENRTISQQGHVYVLLPGKHRLYDSKKYISIIGMGSKRDDVQLEIGRLKCIEQCHISNVDIKSLPDVNRKGSIRAKNGDLELLNCSLSVPVKVGNAVLRNCVLTGCKRPAVQVMIARKLVLLDQCVIEHCCMDQDDSSAIEIHIPDIQREYHGYNTYHDVDTKVTTKLRLCNVKFSRNKNADIGYSIPPAECDDIFTINLSKALEPVSTYLSVIDSFHYKCYEHLKLTQQVLNVFVRQRSFLRNIGMWVPIQICKPTIAAEPPSYVFDHQVDRDIFAYKCANTWLVLFSKPVRWVHNHYNSSKICQICSDRMAEYHSSNDAALKLVRYVSTEKQPNCIIRVCNKGHLFIEEWLFGDLHSSTRDPLQSLDMTINSILNYQQQYEKSGMFSSSQNYQSITQWTNPLQMGYTHQLPTLISSQVQSSTSQLATWLSSIGLQSYYSILEYHGYDLTFIREIGIEEEDLDAMGIVNRGDRRKLLAKYNINEIHL
jgi:hypothetical protein